MVAHAPPDSGGSIALEKLTILLIEDNPDYSVLVRHWLAHAGDEVEYELHWADSMAEGRRLLAQGDVSVVLLDLNLPDSEGSATLETVRAFSFAAPVIVLSAGDDVSLALRSIQEGADNYLVKSACNAESLTRAIRYAAVKWTSRAAREEAAGTPPEDKVIGVLGGKGGVGATTLACYLASELRRSSGAPVLLADMDLHSGLVAFLMGVKSEFSIVHAIAKAGRLDRSMWQQVVAQSKEGIDVACSPAVAGPPVEHNGTFAGQFSDFISSIKPFYRWIVLDLGKLSACGLSIPRAADKLLMITSTEMPALYETKRSLEALRAANLGDRVSLAVNQIHGALPCPEAELRTIFGVPICASFPSSSQELQDACLEHKAPARNSAFARELSKLAQAIGGPAEAPFRRPLHSFAERLLGRARSFAPAEVKTSSPLVFK
jgi:Flp pilus assembly CpaE family ATPase